MTARAIGRMLGGIAIANVLFLVLMLIAPFNPTR